MEIHPASKNLRYNAIVNIIDGGFFGFAFGLASLTTIIPLFISRWTDSAILIGLIPSIHTVGWMVPQLFTARQVSKLVRFKPYVLMMTIHERIPFIGLAMVAWFFPENAITTILIVSFLLLIWQGIGGGMTANGWQNLIGKVIPFTFRGTFIGVQSAISNLLSSIGAILAGYILEKLPSPLDFTLCFSIAFVFMALSWVFLSFTKEEARPYKDDLQITPPLWGQVWSILRKDKNFRWFIIARTLSQFSVMAFAFYIVYAVNQHGMSELMAGVMTSILLITQFISNPVLGWIADHWHRHAILEIGAIAGGLSAILAAFAPGLGWFVIVFILEGIANATYWSVVLAITMEFGSEEDRPTYIGMSNTLIAPGAIIAPLLGGWIADTNGYPAAFIAAGLFGFITTIIFHFFVKDPEPVISDPSPSQTNM